MIVYVFADQWVGDKIKPRATTTWIMPAAWHQVVDEFSVVLEHELWANGKQGQRWL